MYQLLFKLDEKNLVLINNKIFNIPDVECGFKDLQDVHHTVVKYDEQDLLYLYIKKDDFKIVVSTLLRCLINMTFKINQNGEIKHDSEFDLIIYNMKEQFKKIQQDNTIDKSILDEFVFTSEDGSDRSIYLFKYNQ